MKQSKLRLVGIILVAFCVLAIWGFSLRPGTASHSQSRSVEYLIENVLNRLNIKIDRSCYKIFVPFVEDPNNITTEVAVRKLAHFTEYFALGFLCALMATAYRHSKLCVGYALLGVFIAYIDERVIQLHFVTGRTSSFRDVLLDCCGYYIAFLAVTLIGTLCLKVKRKLSLKRS